MLFEFRLFFFTHFLKFGIQFVFSVAIFVVHNVRIVLLLHFGCSSICLFGKDLIVLTSDLCRWLFIFSTRFSSFVFFFCLPYNIQLLPLSLPSLFTLNRFIFSEFECIKSQVKLFEYNLSNKWVRRHRDRFFCTFLQWW